MKNLVYDTPSQPRLKVVESGSRNVAALVPRLMLGAGYAFFDIPVEPHKCYRIRLSTNLRDEPAGARLLAVVFLPDEMEPGFECSADSIRLFGAIGLFVRVEDNRASFWFRIGEASVTHLRIGLRSWGGHRVAVADTVCFEAAAAPFLSARLPAFSEPPQSELIPLDANSGYAARLPVSPGRHFAFVWSVPGPPPARDDPSGAEPACEIDFFAADDASGQRRPSCAHYSLPLAAAPPGGAYQAFAVYAPSLSATAATRFVAAPEHGARPWVSPDICLVPASRLTYAGALPDEPREVCLVPVPGTLRSVFTVDCQGSHLIVAELAGSSGDARNAAGVRGTAVFTIVSGAAGDDSGGRVSEVELQDGKAVFCFRAAAPVVVIDIEFIGLPAGAMLRHPLDAVPVES